uniref:Selenocysteine-specific elongation factor n=1 Tax=Gonium pectorale TaxID=33097 RepID=A0A140JWV9_GONPE|nr:eukaryotic elongation factor, selenocysteine-tRNA-specific [Gonium pectorale]
MKRVLNINVGVLGHVDSGKTSLVAALSTQLSTAALDKHPQSKERGITLDLGFSAFTVPLPPHLSHLPYDELQFTLVDCPGHASLIRTIIGGVQIIDMMVLVVDVTKGLQTQTAECLVVGEVATSRMVVALNKVDLLQPEQERPKAVRRAIKRLGATFAMTKFAGVTMIPVSAKPAGQPGAAALGLDDLRAALVGLVPPAPRAVSGPFLFAIDHCFPIKGQGSVLTGTVLQGSVSVNDPLELPVLKLTRPVRSIQMFRSPVQRAVQGDRVGICVTQLDAGLLERGLACAPGTVPTFRGAVAAVEKIRFYAGRVPSRARFHVSVGHSTVMAGLTFFGTPDGAGLPRAAALAASIANLAAMAAQGTPMAFDAARDYLYQDELYGLEGRPQAAGPQPGQPAKQPAAGEGGSEAEAEGEGEEDRHFGPQWVLLQFDQAVTAPRDALVIGAKFDADIHGEACRLAFYGRLVRLVDPSRPEELATLRLFKLKSRSGVIERLQPDGATAIVRGLIKKESDVAVFAGLKVFTGRGEEGVIEGSFGKSGKLKVHFQNGLAAEGRSAEDNVVTLRCKRYIFDPNAKKVLRQ